MLHFFFFDMKPKPGWGFILLLMTAQPKSPRAQLNCFSALEPDHISHFRFLKTQWANFCCYVSWELQDLIWNSPAVMKRTLAYGFKSLGFFLRGSTAVSRNLGLAAYPVPRFSPDIFVYGSSSRLITMSTRFYSQNCPNLGFKICGPPNSRVRMSRLKS